MLANEHRVLHNNDIVMLPFSIDYRFVLVEAGPYN